MQRSPFFSIIVVSYNAEDYIERTIFSILKQSFEDFEIVVKDACSTDKTLEKIPEDNRIRVFSTKDDGIYAGMNEAIEYSLGKYVMFLNCGDVFADADVLLNIYNSAPDNDESIIYGNFTKKGVYYKQPNKVNEFYIYRTTLCHQTVFVGTGVFKKVGGHNTNYRIAADYDFLIRSFKKGIEFVHCDCVICDYMGDGVSETRKGSKIREEEFIKIKKTHFTKKECRKYNFRIALTFPGLRKRIVSQSSPVWLKKIYRRAINVINK